MLARSHSHFVVVVGGGKQRAPRTFGKFCDRHHYRVHRFQYGTASHAHIDSQAVAASRFDSANCCAKVFWTGNLQHWRRVGLPRRAHFHPHRISTAGYFHSIQKCQLLKVASGAFVSRLFQDETRIPSGRIRTSIVRRSDASNDIVRFSRSSVSAVRGPAVSRALLFLRAAVRALPHVQARPVWLIRTVARPAAFSSRGGSR
jgi:hypothetical protein